jgi:hypothetical protein
MPVVEVSADLSVELSGADGETARARLRGTHSELTLDIDNPGLFAGTGDAPMVRAAAEELADRGIRVRVVHDGVHLVTIGAVSAPWWQRRATGSRRIKMGSWRGAWTSLRSRAGGTSAVLPSAESLPPPTMFPLAPTFARRRRRRPTTTHDPHRSGSPRLVVEKADLWPGERQQVFWLQHVETTIGSDPACDVVLPGLAPHHSSVLHTDSDEYVLTNLGPEVRVHGAVVTGSATLRTGARVDLGEHALAFAREEYADHGRPFGGRVGGEAGRQRPQPPRRSHGPASAGR